MSSTALVAVGASALFAVGTVRMLVPPPRRLERRVRPYLASDQPDLGRSVNPISPDGPHSPIAVLLRPLAVAIGRRVVRWGRPRVGIGTLLRQSGLYRGVPEAEAVDAYRLSLVARAAGLAAGLGLFGSAAGGIGAGVGFAFLGAAIGVVTARSRVDHAVAERRVRMRVELYTLNQLLALRTRVGGGVSTALRHVVARANGEVVDEFADVLRLHRSGWSMRDALERAAESTPEPEAARTYRVLAAASERGGDLADALLGLSRDLRRARRQQLKERAAKRRLLLVVPIVVILAPVVLLFVAAPLPSLIFGN